MSKEFHTLKINQIVRETEDSVSVQFEIPNDLKDKFQFTSGQYLTFKSEINGNEIRRSYSLCTAPFEEKWKVTVKKIQNGLFSTYANEKLKIGDVLEVSTPNGNFKHNTQNNPKNYLLFAAGSGITPIISILKNILKTETNSTVSLFYGNQHSSSVIFKEELEGLKNLYLTRFSLQHFFSKEDLGNSLQNGRIDKNKCKEICKKLISFDKKDNIEVFVCGSEEMVHDIKDCMLEWGVDEKAIHFELFGVKKQNKQIPQEIKKIHSKVKIIQDGYSYDIELDSDADTILEAGINAGADLPYSCKGGVCCTCKAKVIEGKVKMDLNYSLEPEETEEGYILTCQAHPISENVVISFDE
ncbi:MAG: 2Fe-2S iron-sulfur cluster binding domain-containing protein [Flavobacteriia bacterium]|nr:2Fe-2S iron-sulfur cluster binding domain-containing protein [Flavobacteriia bacterium]